MHSRVGTALGLVRLSATCVGQEVEPKAGSKTEAAKVTLHSQGLHGYIDFGHEELPAGGAFSAGMGF